MLPKRFAIIVQRYAVSNLDLGEAFSAVAQAASFVVEHCLIRKRLSTEISTVSDTEADFFTEFD